MKRVLGIDPGLQVTGYGIIDVNKSKTILVDYGTIKSKSKNRLEDRLEEIFVNLNVIINKHCPNEASVEQIFHSVNAKSALVLGHARGVAFLACKLKNIKCYEYSASKIKHSVTNQGLSSKEQLKNMIKMLFSLDKNLIFDEADALAAAVCHASHQPLLSVLQPE